MPIADENRFGKRLKELRKNAGFSLAGLGAAAGMAKGSVAQLEAGRRQPTWDTVQSLCKALGVDCREFQDPPATTKKGKR